MPEDDLTQEGSLAAWRYRGDYSPGIGTLAGFLLMKANFAMLDAWRSQSYLMTGGRKSRRKEKILSLGKEVRSGLAIDPADEFGSVAIEIFESQEDFETLICKAANFRERRMLRMRFLYGKSLREIGDACGLHETRIAQILQGVFKLLRDMLPGLA